MRVRRLVGSWAGGCVVALVVFGLLRAASAEETSAGAGSPPAPGAAAAPKGPEPAATARPTQAAGVWEKVSNSDGIMVERRAVPGSNLKEFRGRGVIEAPLPRVLAVLQDAPHRAEWMSDCSSSYIVEEDHDKRTQIAYHRTKAPWPVADRDSINRAEIRLDVANRRVVLPFEGIEHPKGPPVKGVVRMPFIRGHWILAPARGGKATEVEYQVHANPGGSLPDWIANLASKKLPQQTLIGLRRQVKFREYPALEAEIMSSPEARQILGETAKTTSVAAPSADRTDRAAAQ